jgi:hypothetical protein
MWSMTGTSILTVARTGEEANDLNYLPTGGATFNGSHCDDTPMAINASSSSQSHATSTASDVSHDSQSTMLFIANNTFSTNSQSNATPTATEG